MSNEKRRVFISYAHANAALAERIAEALFKSSVPFTIDHVLLEPGQSLTGRLGDALDNAAAVIALISEQSIASAWVQRELSAVHALGTRVVPVRCDDAEWPSRLVLQLGDPLYVDARSITDAVGRLPKAFVRIREELGGDLDLYFPLATRQRVPHCRVFPGSLQSALDEVAFGRVLLIVPTDQAVNLSGKVTQAVFNFIGLSAEQLEPSAHSISSRQVAFLTSLKYKSVELHLAAATVFNSTGTLRAEDQRRSAEAVLEAARERNCSLLLAPTMGTGIGGWPTTTALRHWIFGAIRWASTNFLLTEDTVWPVICAPGAGAQARIAQYLRALDHEHLQQLERGCFRFTVDFEGEARQSPSLRYDTFLASVVAKTFPELTRERDLVVLPPSEVLARHPKHPGYSLGDPLDQTPFADGDTIRILRGH